MATTENGKEMFNETTNIMHSAIVNRIYLYN